MRGQRIGAHTTQISWVRGGGCQFHPRIPVYRLEHRWRLTNCWSWSKPERIQGSELRGSDNSSSFFHSSRGLALHWGEQYEPTRLTNQVDANQRSSCCQRLKSSGTFLQNGGSPALRAQSQRAQNSESAGTRNLGKSPPLSDPPPSLPAHRTRLIARCEAWCRRVVRCSAVPCACIRFDLGCCSFWRAGPGCGRGCRRRASAW
jgi:hypothetical protein